MAQQRPNNGPGVAQAVRPSEAQRRGPLVAQSWPKLIPSRPPCAAMRRRVPLTCHWSALRPRPASARAPAPSLPPAQQQRRTAMPGTFLVITPEPRRVKKAYNNCIVGDCHRSGHQHAAQELTSWSVGSRPSSFARRRRAFALVGSEAFALVGSDAFALVGSPRVLLACPSPPAVLRAARGDLPPPPPPPPVPPPPRTGCGDLPPTPADAVCARLPCGAIGSVCCLALLAPIRTHPPHPRQSASL